eukprot:5618630-Prymnesium_polylepis.1
MRAGGATCPAIFRGPVTLAGLQIGDPLPGATEADVVGAPTAPPMPGRIEDPTRVGRLLSGDITAQILANSAPPPAPDLDSATHDGSLLP